MKILLLGFTKVKFMPYAKFYLENIDTCINDVSFVYWNRDLVAEDLSMLPNIKFYEFKLFMEDSIPKKNKIKKFIKYRQFVKKIINNTQFDLIISLHTLPGLLILDKLFFYYRKQYILDFRDVTFEYNKLYCFLVKVLSNISKVTFVSSDAYRKYLPVNQKTKIITSHNLLKDSLCHREYKKNPSKVIRIAFWGLLRHSSLNKIIIDHLAGDERFELHYYGREQGTGKTLKTYVENIKAKNIFFHGEYLPEDRYKFVRNTDIIHNIYKDTNTILAMGNKYYDGIIFRIPQICMLGSQMAYLCKKYNVGYAIDPYSESFSDNIYNYYTQLDTSKFNQACDNELNRVLVEYNNSCTIVAEICNY